MRRQPCGHNVCEPAFASAPVILSRSIRAQETQESVTCPSGTAGRDRLTCHIGHVRTRTSSAGVKSAENTCSSSYRHIQYTIVFSVVRTHRIWRVASWVKVLISFCNWWTDRHEVFYTQKNAGIFLVVWPHIHRNWRCTFFPLPLVLMKPGVPQTFMKMCAMRSWGSHVAMTIQADISKRKKLKPAWWYHSCICLKWKWSEVPPVNMNKRDHCPTEAMRILWMKDYTEKKKKLECYSITICSVSVGVILCVSEISG